MVLRVIINLKVHMKKKIILTTIIVKKKIYWLSSVIEKSVLGL